MRCAILKLTTASPSCWDLSRGEGWVPHSCVACSWFSPFVGIGLLVEAGPLAVTSANRSGGPELLDEVSAQEEFGDEVAVYLEGTSPGGRASTVVDATGPSVVVLREGPVTI